ncbi:MAG: Gfo/Idh/MocA family oxidoreductase, partial [Armatimonadetes bacterium]|nr:Gfo/Idh/MocA family oxidoreductase [Armatimonadota bacterium]
MALKIGIVGCGGIGNVHADAYAKNPKAEIVAACDIIPERADALAAKHGGVAYYSVKEMLASGVHLDACSMCTKGEENGGDHFQPTMELLEAGIPTLGEKPISNRIDEGEKMVALAREKKVPYAINLNHRFTPA